MNRLHPVFNVVKLTQAPTDLIPGQCASPPPPPEIIDGEEEWVVEEILNSRIINQMLRYLVKWKGFGVEHNSWEPWDNVHADLVTDFYRQHPGATHQIRAAEFDGIPFCSVHNSTVPGHHLFDGGGGGGLDVRGLSISDRLPIGRLSSHPFPISHPEPLHPTALQLTPDHTLLFT
jgi:Chromo (CHRromatin Organisation MOdifier) domain